MTPNTERLGKLNALLARISSNAQALREARLAPQGKQQLLTQPEPERTPFGPPVVLDPRPSVEPAIESEPSSVQRRAALNPDVPLPPAVPSLPQISSGPTESIAAPGERPGDEELGPELITIPPSAPRDSAVAFPEALTAPPPGSGYPTPPAPSGAFLPPETAPSGQPMAPSEPVALADDTDFASPRATPSQVENDFSLSAPPPLEEIEAPPISTEQQRDEESLESTLAFAPPAVEPGPLPVPDGEEDLSANAAPRTPPPESGPQVSLIPKEVETLEGSNRPHEGDGPTMEQLGATIDLEAGDRISSELQLAERGESSPGLGPVELEAELPTVGFAGAYSSELAPPASARDELLEHDRLERERVERRSSLSLAPVTSEPSKPASFQAGASEAVSRPTVNVSAPAVLYQSGRGQAATGSFLDRLDTSLGLIPPNE
jgi:hypothetical protein